MTLEPVHFDFVESPYDPSLVSRRGTKPGPFPLVGLTAAQFDALSAWDVQLDAERADDRANDDVAEPMTDRPRPQGDPLEREINRGPDRGLDREGRSPSDRGERVRKADDLPVDERP